MEREGLLQMAELNINNRRYPLYEGINTIGRNRQAVVNIVNMNISQNHSIIVILKGEHYISDLKSSNGSVINDTKLIPLKLYPLKNNSKVTFGTLTGTFVSEGNFSNEYRLSQSSIASQSVYEGNTQLLDSNLTQSFDLHDAPTQEICWSNLKTSFKSKLPPVPQAVFEKVVDENAKVSYANRMETKTDLTSEKDSFVNNENSPLVANTEIYLKSSTEIELVNNEKVIDQIPESRNCSVNSLIDEDDDLTEVLTSNQVSHEFRKVERPSRPVFSNVDDDDDDLTDCEESTFVPKRDVLTKNTERVDGELSEGTKPQSSPVFHNDDALTDCVSQPAISLKQNTEIELPHDTADFFSELAAKHTPSSPMHIIAKDIQAGVESNKIHEAAEAISPVSQTIDGDDDLTDCEDDVDLIGSNSKVHPSTSVSKSYNLVATEDSNDSIKFSVGNDNATFNTSDEGKSDSEDSGSFTRVANKKKNSFMVITSQDLPETTDTFQRQQSKSDLDTSSDEVFISRRSRKSCMVISTQDFEPSCSDTQIYDTSTKNISNFDVSIPATQEVSGVGLDETDCIPATQVVHPQIKGCVSQSTQESFKLGITQMMMEGKEVDSQNQALSLGVSFDKPGSSEGNNKIGVNVDEGLFLAPTQKLVPGKEKTQEETEFYDVTTQKMSDKADDDDMFQAPTQQIVFGFKQHNKSELSGVDFFHAPTQKVVLLNKATQDDIFFAPTQKLIKTYDKGVSADYDASLTDLYEAPTQTVSLGPVQSSCQVETATSDDSFSAPTQKIIIPTTSTERTDLIDIPEEDENTTDSNNGDIEMEKTEGRKKRLFLFKKMSYNLDASLSKIIDNKIPEPAVKVFDSSVNVSTHSATILSKNNSTLSSSPMQVTTECENNSTQSRLTPKGAAQRVSEKESVKLDDSSVNVSVHTASTVSKLNDNLSSGFVRLTAECEEKSAQRNVEINESSFVASNSRINESSQAPKIVSPVKEEDIAAVKPGKGMKPRGPTKNLDFKGERTAANATTSSFSTNNNGEITHNSFNATYSEMNKSVAILESKLNKTRKSRNVSKIEVSVPKSRRSMSISVVDKPPEVVNVDVACDKPKRGRKSAKETEKSSYLKDKKSTVPSDTVEEEVAIEPVLSRSSRSNRRANEKTMDDPILIKSSTQNKKQLGKIVDDVDKSSRRRTNKCKPTVDGSKAEETVDSAASTSTTTRKSRNVTKRRNIVSVEEENDSKSDSASPAKRQKIQLNEAALSTPQRELRRQRHKVVFTMMDSPQLESLIKLMGGSIVDSVKTCSVLITEHVKRSQKLLSAVGLGIPICSPKWITDSKKHHEFLDPWDYILTDPEAEEKWKFSLKESLKRGRDKQLLASYNFNIQVTTGVDVLKGAIECCGGKVISKIPSTPLENTYIISSPDNKSKYSKIIKKQPHLKVIEAEAIFDGVLRQELRFERHALN